MAYYTYSQGFRPGGFNRTVATDGTVVAARRGTVHHGQADRSVQQAVGYDSDNLTNDEIGVKSEFFDHRLQVNASVYKMKWTERAAVVVRPGASRQHHLRRQRTDYEVKGVELQLVARVTEGLTVQGSSSWNSTNQTNAPCLTSNVPGVQRATRHPSASASRRVNGVALHQSVRRARHLAGVLAAPAVQPAGALRLSLSATTSRSPWSGANHIGSHAQRAGQFPGRRQPAALRFRPPRCCSTRCRATRPTMRRSAWPRTTGRLQLYGSNLIELRCQHQYHVGSVHQVGSAAAAAGADAADRRTSSDRQHCPGQPARAGCSRHQGRTHCPPFFYGRSWIPRTPDRRAGRRRRSPPGYGALLRERRVCRGARRRRSAARRRSRSTATRCCSPAIAQRYLGRIDAGAGDACQAWSGIIRASAACTRSAAIATSR